MGHTSKVQEILLSGGGNENAEAKDRKKDKITSEGKECNIRTCCKVADCERELDECRMRIERMIAAESVIRTHLRRLTVLACEDLERSGDKTTLKNETVLEILRSQSRLSKFEVLPHIPSDIYNNA